MICGKGIAVPCDLAHGETDSKGADGFVRYASKLATGTGKTTVMAMLSAWSILNKIIDRSDKRFSDTVLVVCPNVPIRKRSASLIAPTSRAASRSLYQISSGSGGESRKSCSARMVSTIMSVKFGAEFHPGKEF